MKTHPLAERQVITLVQAGVLAIDSFGRVWRLGNRRRLANGDMSLWPLAPRRAENTDPDGYLQVRAVIDGKRWCAGAHRLVWQHFYGDIPDGLTVNHVDGRKDQNRPSNLELATEAQQVAHAVALGLRDDEARRLPNGRYGPVRRAA